LGWFVCVLVYIGGFALQKIGHFSLRRLVLFTQLRRRMYNPRLRFSVYEYSSFSFWRRRCLIQVSLCFLYHLPCSGNSDLVASLGSRILCSWFPLLFSIIYLPLYVPMDRKKLLMLLLILEGCEFRREHTIMPIDCLIFLLVSRYHFCVMTTSSHPISCIFPCICLLDNCGFVVSSRRSTDIFSDTR